MAVKFKDLYDKVYNAPLSEKELEIISKAEERIDNELVRRYRGGSVEIPLSIIEFKGISVDDYLVTEPRKKLMKQNLIKRYEDSGWSCVEMIDHNNYGDDYISFRNKFENK